MGRLSRAIKAQRRKKREAKLALAAEAEAEAMKASMRASTTSVASKATKASKAAPKTKTKKKDASSVEDPHGKMPAGRKPPPATTKKPSTTDKPRRKKKAKLPLLFQRMPQLMNYVDDPSSIDSLVNHLSSWKPLETAAVKAPPDDGGGKPSAVAPTKTTNSESEGRVDDEAIGDATTKSVELEESMAVEAIAVDEASMETSTAEAEAPTTADKETPAPVEVPMLT